MLDVDLGGDERQRTVARGPAAHPDSELLVDLPQGGVKFAVADDVVVDDVVAQRRRQAAALSEDIVDAILDDLHGAAELALLGWGERCANV